jgi:hypothetical protein
MSCRQETQACLVRERKFFIFRFTFLKNNQLQNILTLIISIIFYYYLNTKIHKNPIFFFFFFFFFSYKLFLLYITSITSYYYSQLTLSYVPNKASFWVRTRNLKLSRSMIEGTWLSSHFDRRFMSEDRCINQETNRCNSQESNQPRFSIYS